VHLPLVHRCCSLTPEGCDQLFEPVPFQLKSSKLECQKYRVGGSVRKLTSNAENSLAMLVDLAITFDIAQDAGFEFRKERKELTNFKLLIFTALTLAPLFLETCSSSETTRSKLDMVML
jgi:hypothetical protein